MSDKQSNGLPILIVLVALGLLAWPMLSGGCTPRGLEISSWLGKVRLKPLPPEPVVVVAPPATRCLVFSATWCKPCGQLKRNVAAMARTGWRIGPLTTDDIEFIDVDGPDPRIKQYRHSSVPTLVIVDQAGKEIARREDVQTADELGEWIRSTRK